MPSLERNSHCIEIVIIVTIKNLNFLCIYEKLKNAKTYKIRVILEHKDAFSSENKISVWIPFF